MSGSLQGLRSSVKNQKVSSWPKAINSGVRGRAPGDESERSDALILLSVFVHSLRDLFRPTSHLFALQEQELLRHGCRNHKHSPHCGLDRNAALTRSRTKTSRPQPAAAHDKVVFSLKSTMPTRPGAVPRPLRLSDAPCWRAVVRILGSHAAADDAFAAPPPSWRLPPMPSADSDWSAATWVRETCVRRWHAPRGPVPHSWLSERARGTAPPRRSPSRSWQFQFFNLLF